MEDLWGFLGDLWWFMEDLWRIYGGFMEDLWFKHQIWQFTNLNMGDFTMKIMMKFMEMSSLEMEM